MLIKNSGKPLIYSCQAFINFNGVCKYIFLFISINLVIFGKVILYVISPYLHLPDEFVNTILILRCTIAFILLFILAMINYYVLPARDFSLKKKV